METKTVQQKAICIIAVLFFYLFANNNVAASDYWNNQLNDNTSIAVAPSISASPVSVVIGASVTVTVSGGPGNSSDWVGFYQVGAADASYSAWQYLNGTQTVPSAGLTSATLTFTAPSTAGTYEFRLFASNGYTLLATSNTITVTAGNQGPPSKPIPASFFSMHVIEKKNYPTVPIGNLAKGTFINWPYIEATKGVRDWSNLDGWVNAAIAHGVPTFYAFWGAPGWAVSDQSSCNTMYGYKRCGGMPDLTAYDSFVKELVTRYKGKIAMYELYNEPHMGIEGFTGTMSEFVVLMKHTYDIIKAIDPAALIAAPSGKADFLDQYWSAGGIKTVDLLTIHAYPDPAQYSSANYPAAEKVCCGNFLIGPHRKVFAKHGMTQPIWDTEGSWTYQDGAMADEDNQVAFVPRFALLHWSEGIELMAWYAWDNSKWGCLWDPTNGEHKAAKAMRETYNWMVGATMPSPCTWSGPKTSHMPAGTIGSCPLTRPGGYKALAVWNTNGPTTYTPPTIYTQYRDINGNTKKFTPGTTINIGYKPILLENSVSTGIPSLPRVADVTFYPNPTTGIITLDVNLEEQQVLKTEIKNMLGEAIYSLPAETFTQKQLDISFLPNGIYFIEVSTKDKILSREKIIKIKQ